MATDVSKSLKNLEITIPYALLRSWASLTTGQEILHYAKDYKGTLIMHYCSRTD